MNTRSALQLQQGGSRVHRRSRCLRSRRSVIAASERSRTGQTAEGSAAVSRWLPPLLLMASSAQAAPIAITAPEGWPNATDRPVQNPTIVTSAGNGIFAGQAARLNLAERPDIVERARAALFMTAGGSAAHAAGGSRAAIWGELRNALAEARSLRGLPSPFKPRDQLLNHVDIEALSPVLEKRLPLAAVAQRDADIRQALAVARDFGISVVI